MQSILYYSCTCGTKFRHGTGIEPEECRVFCTTVAHVVLRLGMGLVLSPEEYFVLQLHMW